MSKSDDIGLLDRKRLFEIFYYLNERLKENLLQLDITVYGGSVMTMVYDERPATRDIDCVFGETNTVLLSNILELTQFTFNLPDEWINENVAEPLKSLLKEDIENFKVFSNLRIFKPNAKQLLAMKVLAARAEPAKDFMDVGILCKDLNIRSKSALLKVVSEYIPLTLIGERQRVFIKYLGEDMGYDWE